MEQRGTKTVLAWGEIEVPVALYKTARDKRDEVGFDRAGPNGGRLKAPTFAGPAVGEDETIASGKLTVPEGVDIFAEDPESSEPEPAPEPAWPRGTGAVLVEEGTGVEIKRSQDVRRGVFDNAGTFHDLTEHLAAVDTITRLDEMRVEGFINRYRVAQGRIIGSYWIAPDGQGTVLRLFWTAMADEYRAAVVRWTKRTRQALGVIIPSGKGLLLLELSWQALLHEPRPEVVLMTDRQVEGPHLKLARDLVMAMAVDEKILDTFEDEGARLRTELHAAAMAGTTPPLPKPKRDAAPTAALAEALG